MGQIILITANECPGCDEIKAVLEEKFGKNSYIEFNIDEKEEYRNFALMYAVHTEHGIPVPQIVYIKDEDDEPHYVMLCHGISIDMLGEELQKRIERIERGEVGYRYYMLIDLVEAYAWKEETDELIPLLEYYFPMARRIGLLARLEAFGKVIFVDLIRFSKVLEKKGMCLCVPGLRCPCPAFIQKQVCRCGVFFAFDPKDLAPKKMEDLERESEQKD